MNRRARTRASGPRGACLLVAVLLLLLVCPAPAGADLFGPDDSFSQASGPLQRGVTYSGVLNHPGDLDYLFYDVGRAGEALRFTVRNTLRSCSSTYGSGCPLWATLLDSNQHQLGGEGSSAGTGEVDYGATDYIDWTFPQPGRYYIVVENGDELPSYSLRLDPVSASSPRLPVLRSLRVVSPQRGVIVRARLVFGQAIARLEADLIDARGGVRVGKLVRHRVASGPYALAVRLTSATARATLKRKHRLAVVLRMIARSSSGQTQTVSRHVTLRA